MWFTIQNQEVRLQIYAKPHAKKTAIVGVNEQGLCIALHAKPVQGAANEALIAYLAELLELPQKQVRLLKGESSKHKQIVVPLVPRVLEFLNEYRDKYC